MINIYLENDEIKVKGTINLGYIGLFKDSQIELEDSLEDIRDWDIIEDYYNPECSDDELVDYLNVYFNTFIENIEKNIDKEFLTYSINKSSVVIILESRDGARYT